MFSSHSRSKFSRQELLNTIIVFPIISIPLATAFAFGAFKVGRTWKGIVLGLASLWMVNLTFWVIQGTRHELRLLREGTEKVDFRF